ncbi:MAG: YIP1 family protein [Anaerolineae bacterium]
MFERIIGVFKLDRQVFADIEHDSSATTQAAIVVAIVAGLSVIGTILQTLINIVRGDEFSIVSLLLSVIGTFVVAFVNWVIWSAITYLVGTKLFKGEATLNEMLRVIGFAYAPRMLSIIPCIGGIVGAIWSLVASYFAIKEGLDLDDTGTIVTILVGWLVTVVIGFVLGLLGLGGALDLGALGGLFGG